MIFILEVLMIKRIIFDIDNTLLNTDLDCQNIYQQYFKDEGVHIDGMKLYNLIGDYYHMNGDFTKRDLEKYVQKHLYANFNIDKMLDVYGKVGTLLHKDISSTLAYLMQKYELVALSNWYVESQSNRLKQAGIYKYFNTVYGFENAGLKPSQESFKIAMGNNKPDECLMVGDSIHYDIEVPNKMGMQTYYLTNELNNQYGTIKSISELKVLL